MHPDRLQYIKDYIDNCLCSVGCEDCDVIKELMAEVEKLNKRLDQLNEDADNAHDRAMDNIRDAWK